MNQAPRARRLWLPLSVTAVPVRVVLDSAGDMDALEEAIIGLLRLAPRDATELGRKLHISSSLVLSALAQLADRGLVAVPEDSGSLYTCVIDTRLMLADAARPGWAFYFEGLGTFIPTIVLSERAPTDSQFRPAGDVVIVEGDRPTSSSSLSGAMDRSLQSLLSTRDLLVIQPSGTTETHSVVLDGDSLPLLGGVAPMAQLRSMVIEWGRSRRAYRHTAWVPIDLLPRMRGSAVAVFHEPVIDPAEHPDSPIASRLGEWIERQDRAAWLALRLETERVRIDMSLVLTRAGIDSEAEFDRQVDQHAREVADRVRLDGVRPPPGDPGLVDKIREAQRWLVLAQREATFRAQARDAWAHAVEELGAALAGLARPHLERWKANKQRTVPTEIGVQQRLALLGLRGELGPSESHVVRWATDQTLARRLDTITVGAGASLTLWLLPLLLLDTEASRQYAAHVKTAKDRNPDLFDHLAELVAVRDYTFHEGRTRNAAKLSSDLPEHIERCFMAVFAALHVGLATVS